jgi:hypothetical protein
MNPAILGALIGAVPGTIAAALATWASVRSSKLAVEQAQLAWVTEHANWLRDKRSDLYVEGISSLHEASVSRARLIKAGAEASLLREEVGRILQSYSESAWHDRLARAEAYLPDDASSVYLAAAEGDWHIWRAVQESLSANDEMKLVITDELANDLKDANLATRKFSELARRDLLKPAAGWRRAVIPEPSEVT